MGRLTDEQKEMFENSILFPKIIENNRKITELMNENENMIVNYFNSNGIVYDPLDNYTFFDRNDETTSIIIPKEYVYTDVEIEELFHIDRLFDTTAEDEIIKKNCKCEIRKASMYSYFLHRFKIYGGMRKIMYKDIIVSMTAVMEQVFKTGAIRLLEYNEMVSSANLFSGSEKTDKGYRFFYRDSESHKWKFDKNRTYDEWLKLYESKNIIPEFNSVNGDNDNAYVKYRDLKNIRNTVHISVEDNYIMYEPKFSEEMVNKSILGVKVAVLGILEQMK